jgi:predicted nucleic-acid-binding protein
VISLDTNILIRTIVLDDHDQVARAMALMLENVCFIARSVVQEVVWVLTKSYKFKVPQIATVLEQLLGSDQIVLEDEVIIQQAVLWYRQGFDFADALHLASSKDCVSLATFDQAFIKAAAATQTPIPVNHP